MRALIVIGLCACGRIGFAPSLDADLARGDAVVLGQFGPATKIPSLASAAQDDDPALSPDLRELYFASDRLLAGDNDLWVSTRTDPDSPWRPPTHVAELSQSAKTDSGPFLFGDGLTIWFVRGGDVMESTRVATDAPWGVPSQILTAGSLQYGAPTLCTKNADARMFVRARVTGGLNDLYVVTRSTAGVWEVGNAVAELNTPGDESGPHATSTCDRMYFDSDRDGTNAIYVADLDSQSGTYRAPLALAEINALGRVSDAVLSADETYIVFRHTVSGNQELFEAQR